jgi:non-ribosomal peptide synthetase component F
MKSDINKTILEKFDETVESFSDKLAVKYENVVLTYKELDVLVNRIANHESKKMEHLV